MWVDDDDILSSAQMQMGVLRKVRWEEKKRERRRTCWRGSVSFALFSAARMWSRVVVAERNERKGR